MHTMAVTLGRLRPACATPKRLRFGGGRLPEPILLRMLSPAPRQGIIMTQSLAWLRASTMRHVGWLEQVSDADYGAAGEA